MRVAFFQRIFAFYQTGLVKELASHSLHEYHFFGDRQDPLQSGIHVIPEKLCHNISFTYCRTKHYGRYLAFQWRAVKEALLGPYDAFVFEGSITMPTNWIALLLAKIRGKKVFIYTHGWKKRDSFWMNLIRQTFYGLSNGILLYGCRARKLGERSGVSPNKLYVVYNCLDDNEIREYLEIITEDKCQNIRRKWFGYAADNPLIVSVGRLVSAKRFSLLIDAAEILLCEGLQVNLLLVGDGPEQLSLKEQAKKAGVLLAFTGAQHEESFISDVFAAADLSVIPGAAGLSVIHSLSYGTPVVVHNNQAIQMPEAEAVEIGVNGSIFNEGDVADLARVIRDVLDILPRGPLTFGRCRNVIDKKFNAAYMRKVFDEAIIGNFNSGTD
jgi:glycosyltransferase involved in cell wall biosynthesis